MKPLSTIVLGFGVILTIEAVYKSDLPGKLSSHAPLNNAKSQVELVVPVSHPFVCNSHYSRLLDDLYVAIKDASPDLIITHYGPKEKFGKDSHGVFSYNSLLNDVAEHIDDVKEDKRIDIICQTKEVANTAFSNESIYFEADIVKALYDRAIVMIQDGYSLDLLIERIDFAHSLAQSAGVQEAQYVERAIETLYDVAATIIKQYPYYFSLDPAKERIDFAHSLAQSTGVQEARYAERAIEALYDSTAKLEYDSPIIKEGYPSPLDSARVRINLAHFLAQSAGVQEAQYAEPVIESLYNIATTRIKYGPSSLDSARVRINLAHFLAQSAGVQEAQYAEPVVKLLCDKAETGMHSKAEYVGLALIVANNAKVTACDT